MSVLVVLATFLAAGVEWVEALTIVLAVGIFRNWRSSLGGAMTALAVLAILVVALGLTVTHYVSIADARSVVGIVLLLLGLGWLYKAILRSAGLKSERDEAQVFAAARERLSQDGRPLSGLDWTAAFTSFNGVFLEGLEVVFIVVALGGFDVRSALAGALTSLVVVTAAGVALRHPLTRIPENTTKYIVGVMLTSFGTFFAGEGMGVIWWNGDLSILLIIAAYYLASLAFVQVLRRPLHLPLSEVAVLRVITAAVREVWGVFVTDSWVAVFAVVALLGVTVFIQKVAGHGGIAAVLLVVGILLAIGVGLNVAARSHARSHPSGTTTPEGVEEESSPSRASAVP
jgi:uncharacterized membrane protein